MRFRLLSCLALSFALFAAVFLAAAPGVRAEAANVPWSPELLVTATGTNDYSTVLTDGAGHVYVFYETNTAPGQSNLSVAKFTTSGPFGFPRFLLARQITAGTWARTLAYGTFISAAMDGSGDVFVGWTMASGYTGGHGNEIFVSKSADGGNTWLAPVLANSPTGYGDDSSPSLTVEGNGTLWVAWSQSWNGFTNISTSFSTTAGASFAGYRNVTTSVGQYYGHLFADIRSDALGRIYLAYSWQDSTFYWDVNVTWSDTGSSWSAPVQLSPGSTYSYYPNLAVDAAGRVYISWWDNRFAPGWTIWYRLSTDRGATWQPEILVNTQHPSGGNGPHLTVLGANVVDVWAGNSGSGQGLGYAISTDSGQTWSADQVHMYSAAPMFNPSSAVDENGTVWASFTQGGWIYFAFWNIPPSPPTITSIAPGDRRLTVDWTTPPEKDVAGYRVWRSIDGSTYQAVATVSAPITEYIDTGLANGTYWYRIAAFDTYGDPSVPSQPWSGTVGPTTAQLIANLEGQISSLWAQLNTTNVNVGAVQAQLNSLQGQLNNLKSTDQANFTKLQGQLTQLQNQLNSVQSQQASNGLLGTILEAVIVFLLIVVLFVQLRKPRPPAPIMMAPEQRMAMPPSSPPPPSQPEDEL